MTPVLGGEFASRHTGAFALLAGLRPDPEITVSEWADRERIVTTGPRKGLAWITDIAPYQREVMDCLSTQSDVGHVVVCKAAQLGFSEIAVNWIGYVVAHAPADMIYLMPSDSARRTISRTRSASRSAVHARTKNVARLAVSSRRSRISSVEWRARRS